MAELRQRDTLDRRRHRPARLHHQQLSLFCPLQGLRSSVHRALPASSDATAGADVIRASSSRRQRDVTSGEATAAFIIGKYAKPRAIFQPNPWTMDWNLQP
jgi:hypothetical protein